MNKVEWHLKKWQRELGGLGSLGLILMLIAFVILVAINSPLTEKLSHIRNQLISLKEMRNVAALHPEAQSMPTETGLTVFYRNLPAELSATQQIKNIYKFARLESLQLTQGEYKYTKEKDAHLANYQITLPIKGNYLQIRKFIAKVMNSMPMVALNEVSFRRETISGVDIEARIQFTLFLRVVS